MRWVGGIGIIKDLMIYINPMKVRTETSTCLVLVVAVDDSLAAFAKYSSNLLENRLRDECCELMIWLEMWENTDRDIRSQNNVHNFEMKQRHFRQQFVSHQGVGTHKHLAHW